MKASKIVVFMLIIILLGAGLYVFQKNKQNKELVAHNQKKFDQIKTAAKKNPAAGLLQMASALNHYKKVKGVYPKELIQLYPEFISDKPFITTLGWSYKTGKGKYHIERSDKRYFYSMGPDMRLETGRKMDSLSSNRIASAKNQKKSKVKSVFVSAKTSPKTKLVVRKDLVGVKAGKVKINGTRKISKTTPEFIVEKNELSEDEKFLLSMNNSNLYIWKSDRGVIGFSNVQYPDEKNLTIYENKSWVTYQYNKKTVKQK